MRFAETASGLLNQAYMLRVMRNSLEAVAAYDELIRRHAEAEAADTLELVAKAFYNKGTALEELDRDREAVAAYEGAVKCFGRIAPVLERQFAEAIRAGDRLRENLLRITAHILARLRARVHFNLGVLREEGKGVPEDAAKAARHYAIAAAEGHATAQCKLGFMYGTGRGVPQDHAEALKWYRLAAEGDANAPLDAQAGRESPHDYGPLRTARGDANAQYNLGVLHATGQGVLQDAAEAVKWFRKAAAQGYVRAQQRLDEIRDAGPV